MCEPGMVLLSMAMGQVLLPHVIGGPNSGKRHKHYEPVWEGGVASVAYLKGAVLRGHVVLARCDLCWVQYYRR